MSVNQQLNLLGNNIWKTCYLFIYLFNLFIYLFIYLFAVHQLKYAIWPANSSGLDYSSGLKWTPCIGDTSFYLKFKVALNPMYRFF